LEKLTVIELFYKSRSRVLLEKLTVIQLFYKSHALYRTQRFITIYIRSDPD
jgi:hypothetical protein